MFVAFANADYFTTSTTTATSSSTSSAPLRSSQQELQHVLYSGRVCLSQLRKAHNTAMFAEQTRAAHTAPHIPELHSQFLQHVVGRCMRCKRCTHSSCGEVALASP